MPREIVTPEPPEEPKHKDKKFQLRLSPEDLEQAKQRARPYGGLSAVLRAFLRAFVRGERNFDIDDLTQENTPAPKRRKKK